MNLTADHHVYMAGENGPFRCDHCEYFVALDGGRCKETHIIAYAKLGRFGLTMRPDGLVKVDPAGCSDYFEPK